MAEGNQIEQAERQLKELAVLKAAAAEFETRVPRQTPLELLDYAPKDATSPDVLAPPGSITLFLGRPKSKALSRVREAVKQAAGKDVQLMRELKEVYGRRKMVSLTEAVETLKQQPVIAHLQYGPFTVAKNLFVPDDLELCIVPLPYNGGQLARGGFQLIQAVRPKEKAALEGVMVRHLPPLSPAEKAAIKELPAAFAGFNVGDAAMCYAITAVAIVMVVIFATAACPGSYPDLHLDEAVIKKIGPEATARQLLALRRTIMEKRAV